MLVQRRAAGKRDHGTAPNLNAVANGLGVHPSNATRAVDRLVSAGLLDRSDDPTDRRNLVFELTRSGRDLVDHVMDRRRAAIAAILARMPPGRRRSLVPVMRAFPEAGGEASDDAVWSLGWSFRRSCAAAVVIATRAAQDLLV
jgi:DNA-binding MarR family transcriptional regulator